MMLQNSHIFEAMARSFQNSVVSVMPFYLCIPGLSQLIFGYTNKSGQGVATRSSPMRRDAGLLHEAYIFQRLRTYVSQAGENILPNISFCIKKQKTNCPSCFCASFVYHQCSAYTEKSRESRNNNDHLATCQRPDQSAAWNACRAFPFHYERRCVRRCSYLGKPCHDNGCRRDELSQLALRKAHEMFAPTLTRKNKVQRPRALQSIQRIDM